jgi:hypothetical protein
LKYKFVKPLKSSARYGEIETEFETEEIYSKPNWKISREVSRRRKSNISKKKTSMLLVPCYQMKQSYRFGNGVVAVRSRHRSKKYDKKM